MSSPVDSDDGIRYDWFTNMPPPSDDIEWNGLVQRGEKLFQTMMEPTATSAQSIFTDFPDVYDKWGYKTYALDSPHVKLGHQGITEAVEAIGASVDEKDWETHEVQHMPGYNQLRQGDGSTYQVGDKTYRFTGATFSSVINVKDGIVM
ncbi:hypothetical protein N0V83_003497 [Neocucurbitaria cava]|uniref:Uncharacterized protein n=1 Tax=Neocucurbitaria cava TaxID=798079 RepID=A0A9W8YCF2_9PLEO|nr:hypothetical protein N0V83_003497 [Neocucurbitaria cava]